MFASLAAQPWQEQEPSPPPQQQDLLQERRRAEAAARAAPSALALARAQLAQLAQLGGLGDGVAPPREYVWAPGRIGKLARLFGRPVERAPRRRHGLGAC
jgi:hypothetical protein